MAVASGIRHDPEAVPLGLLRRYLVAKHWLRPEQAAVAPIVEEQSAIMRVVLDGRSATRRSFERFILPGKDEEDVEIILPLERASPDYLRLISGALRTLSDVEGRDPDRIIADVRLVGFDVVRSRIPTALIGDDSVHLEVANNYISGVRSLLAATATTEIQPEPYFLRLKKEATQYADGCRFGHTFRGSFGFTVESPVIPNIDPTLGLVQQKSPFERRVMERLVRGIQAVCDAVARDDPQPLIDSAPQGFSANGCEHFAWLVDKTAPGGMAFSFELSPEWSTPIDYHKRGEFSVGQPHVEISRAAAKGLRSRPVSQPETVTGLVVNLTSEDDPSDLMNPMGEREVAIKWVNPEGVVLSVRVTLSPEEYLQAYAAHGAGRAVTVSGTLEKAGRPWVLKNPTDFRVTE